MTENRKHLASVRVVQRNLVFVVGLSQRLADPEVSVDVFWKQSHNKYQVKPDR